MKLKPLLLMQPYSVAHLHLQQNFTSPQTPNAVLMTGQVPHRFPDVHPNKPTSDIKEKRREVDSASSRTQLEAIPEDLGTNEERESGPLSLARSSRSASLTPSANLFPGTTTSTADIYRRPEHLPQYSYPYNYNYATPSASPSKSTLIPPKITLNPSSSSSTVHGQRHTTVGSTSKSVGSTFPSHPLPQASPTLSPQRRRSRDHLNTTQNAPNRRRKHGIAPLTSDARIEHVLLAARRIGRERAGLIAGIKQHVEHEKEIHARELDLIKARQDLEKSEKERLERLANGTSGLAYYRSSDTLTSPQQRNTGRGSATAGVPRTPKRGGGVGVTHYPALGGALSNSPISSPNRVPASPGPSTFVFVNTSAVAGTSGYSGGGDLSTPDQLGSVHKRGGTARGGSRNLPSNPPTPLDSLLDAARSMMDDGVGAGKKAGGKLNGTRKAPEHPESPVPKRRRVSSSGSKVVGRGGGLAGTSTVTRVKSALDVLADQAAAAFDDEPGQIRRGSNTKGKEKEKSDEGLSGGGDGGVDNAQGDLDDAWPRGSTSASASSMGPSRGSRAKTASINTRPTTEPTSISSMSLRPVRQASQKRLASQELQPPSSISTTTTARGKGKSRGRPKGNKSLPRSAASIKSSSTSKVNSPLNPRVIASATMYSPLDEAIALLPQKDRRERSEEHPHQLTTVDRSPSMGSPRLGLRPVVEWGDRSAEEDEGDEGAEGELGLDQQYGYVEGNAVDAGKVTTSSAESGSTVKITVRDMDAEAQIDTLSNALNDVSPADVDMMTIPPVDVVDTEANAEADLDDEDAEGEQEEEEDDDDAEAGQDRSSRTRTPPPPDPPHPGASSDSNNDDPDADADAEGEMEFEENEELPQTSTSSAVNQTALSVPMGQVAPDNFDGSFFESDGWLIVLLIKSEKSFGCNMISTRALISAMVQMVPGSLPSSLTILSDLSEKMTLRWLTLNKRSLWSARQRGGGQILI